MRIYPGRHWVPADDGASILPIGISLGLDPLRRIAVAAANASAATTGLIFRVDGDGYRLTDWSGDDALPSLAISDRASAAALALSSFGDPLHPTGLWLTGASD